MNLTVQINGNEHAVVPLRDGDDAFNAEAERGALDRAYEAKESNPEDVVTIAVNTNETQRVYLDARFDITDLSREEREGLTLEVYAQAEQSERHPSIEVEVETNEVDLG